MGKLDVGAADHLDRLHDAIGVILELGLQLGINGQHRRHAERVPRVHPHGIHILDETDRDHLVPGVAHDLQFQLLPAQDRFLDEDLAHHAGRNAAADHRPQFLDVIDQAATGAAQRVGGSHHHGVPQGGGDLFRIFNAECRLAARHVDAQPPHGLLEDDPVLPLFDGIGFDTDDADSVLLQHARAGQLRREIQASLATEVGQEGVGTFLLDDFRERWYGERLNVGYVRHAGIGHDGGRVRINQDDLVSQTTQRLAGLGSGIIEFTGLADDNGTRPDNQHFVDIVSFWHIDSMPATLNGFRVQPVKAWTTH